MAIKSSQSAWPRNAFRTQSSTPQARQPRMSVQAAPVATASSSCSSFASRHSHGQITHPRLRLAHPPPSTSANPQFPPKSGGSRVTRLDAERPLAASGLNQGQDGPFDDHIRQVLHRYKDPGDYMRVLKEDLAQYLGLQFDGTKYDHKWDGHVAQLVRVMEQLQKTGECVVGGKIIRP